MTERESILQIKSTEASSDVIGHRSLGGLIEVNGKSYWLRHRDWRYHNGKWNGESDSYTTSDMTENGYLLNAYPNEVTAGIVDSRLEILRHGEMPYDMTTGIEIEGALYDMHGKLIPKHDGVTVDVQTDQHPELLHFTVETATKKRDGHHLKDLVEISQSLADSVIERCSTASKRHGIVVYTSVPEGGNFTEAGITNHPYLRLAAPRVLDQTLDDWQNIPQETLRLYSMFVSDPKGYFVNERILNWPVHALHVHNGVPQLDRKADTRIAHAYGQLRLTEMAKVVSFMLYNTKHFYSKKTSYKDVRSVAKRLLSTTHDSSIPTAAEELIKQTAQQLEKGEIHSPSRYPAKGQHDRVRFRMEGNYKTVESIDAAMTPDLRQVIAWVSFNHILNTIALDTLSKTGGDERLIMPYLASKFPKIFKTIGAVSGIDSSFNQDLEFNRHGYKGSVGGTAYSDILLRSMSFFNDLARQYPALRTQASLLNHQLNLQLHERDHTNLESYFGIEKGSYTPNNKNKGILTDNKGDDVSELIGIQSEATLKQAHALQTVQSEDDLLQYFGVK